VAKEQTPGMEQRAAMSADPGMMGLVGSRGTVLEPRRRSDRARLIRKHWQYYLLFSVPLLYVIIFAYVPMGGILLAFKTYRITQGILRSPWAGLRYFEQFFTSPVFWMLLKNTLSLSVYSLLAGFPLPILLALMLNETTSLKFKKTVQMVTYAPYFISTVVMVSIIMQFLDPRIGFANRVIVLLGGQARNFMGQESLFQSIYVWSGIWQSTGYAAIIYIAALAGIDPTLYEAAYIDGASRLQKVIHIDLPGILPTVVILLILSIGSIMNVGFEKVFLMQNPLNLGTSEIIATYVYKLGILNAQFSFGTAVGLFNSVINLILIASVNQIARRIGETSLW
jgi:putative aldouronate transport system permease protein